MCGLSPALEKEFEVKVFMEAILFFLKEVIFSMSLS